MEKYISGPFAVLLSPFKNGKLDEDSFIKQVKRLSGTKISGYVVNGSTAEFIAMSIEEQKKATELVAKYGDKDKKIVVSACTGNAVDTIEICNHAKSVGAFAVLVCPPYYLKYTPKEREAYFNKVADNSPVPVVLYNIPFFTQELELDIIFRLFEHKNIIGIKDSSANMKRLLHMVEYTKDTKIGVLTGTDDILYPALFGGVVGSMTALAATLPEDICGIYENMANKNYDKAREIQFKLMPILRKADSKTFPRGYKDLIESVSGIPFGDKE